MDDIKILENLASRTKPIAEDLETAVCSIDEQLAIRNLIARNKELESALNNSVSKDEIKEKQQKLYDKAREEEGFIYNHIDEYYYATEILQELLNKGE